MAAPAENPLMALFERHFSPDLPALRFALNTALLSLVGLGAVLAVYIATIPGFGAHLGGGGEVLARFARQILTNGLPVVFAVNWLGLLLFARLRAGAFSPVRVMGFDMPVRLAVFIGLHLAIYPASALMFGSFGGDPWLGLRVVGPTLMQAAMFGNLSGVYLYATLASALPLHMALIGAAWRGDAAPPLAVLGALALGVFAVQAAVLTLLARGLTAVL